MRLRNSLYSGNQFVQLKSDFHPCNSYLLLCNKSPPNIGAENNKPLLHGFCGWRIWMQLGWSLWLWIPQKFLSRYQPGLPSSQGCIWGGSLPASLNWLSATSKVLLIRSPTGPSATNRSSLAVGIETGFLTYGWWVMHFVLLSSWMAQGGVTCGEKCKPRRNCCCSLSQDGILNQSVWGFLVRTSELACLRPPVFPLAWNNPLF